MTKTWAEMTERERMEHSLRHGTDYARKRGVTSIAQLDARQQQAGLMDGVLSLGGPPPSSQPVQQQQTNQQPTQKPTFDSFNSLVAGLQPVGGNNAFQAMWGDDSAVGNNAFNGQYGDVPVSYNAQDVNALAQQILDSGLELVKDGKVYAFANPALNEALYGPDIANNISYDTPGYRTPRQYDPNYVGEFIGGLPQALLQTALGNVAGGLIGGIAGVAGGAQGGTGSLLLNAARQSAEEVNDNRDQGPPPLGGLVGAIQDLPNTGWGSDYQSPPFVQDDDLLNEVLSQGPLEGETFDEWLNRVQNIGNEPNTIGGGGGQTSSNNPSQRPVDGPLEQQQNSVLGGMQGNPDEMGEQEEARYVVISDGVWRDNATGELIYGPGEIGQTTDDQGMGVLWDTGNYSWEPIDEVQEDVEDEEDNPWVTLDPYGDLVWGTIPGILTGDMSDVQTNQPSVIVTQNPSGQPTTNPGGSQNGMADPTSPGTGTNTGGGPPMNGMGPDGGQLEPGQEPGQGGDGSGGGNGGGTGDGTGDGDGEGDGDGQGSQTPVTDKYFGSGDNEFGDLFPYTAINPSRPAQLGGMMDYVAALMALRR